MLLVVVVKINCILNMENNITINNITYKFIEGTEKPCGGGRGCRNCDFSPTRDYINKKVHIECSKLCSIFNIITNTWQGYFKKKYLKYGK